MGKSAPGKSYRKGISLKAAMRLFSDEAKANQWFVDRRWPDGMRCAYCESERVSDRKTRRKTPQYHCKDCGKNFTVKTNTIMHDSKLSLCDWGLAFYLHVTNLKGVSSMKLHRDLEIRQPSAWHMAHRIREAWNDETGQFAGPVEVDETYIGGKERNKHQSKKLNAGRGPVGKTAVVGMKDRDTGQIASRVVEHTDAPELQGFVHEHTDPDAQVYTDEASAYNGLRRSHEAVKHSVKEYVRGQAHVNGVESHWSMLKRGYIGVYHQMSPEHLHRYVAEFEGRHNVRPLDTDTQLTMLVQKCVGKRLPYTTLIDPKATRQPRMI